MSRGSSIGIAIFLGIVVLRAFLNDYIPDDAVTLAMKRAGIFGWVMGLSCSVFTLLVTWLVVDRHSLSRLQAELRRLEKEKARLMADSPNSRDQARQRGHR